MTRRAVASIVTAIFSASLALGAAPVSAQPDAAARGQAAGHSRQAQAYFQRGDFDRALREYQAAYDLSAEPSLIFNIALCHDRAQRPEQALEAFQRYLALVPSSAIADEARDDIARLTPIVEARARARAAAIEQESARVRQEAVRRDEAARTDEALRRDEASRTRRAHIAQYMVAASAVLAAAGATAHVLAWRTRHRLEDEAEYARYVEHSRTFRIERGLAIAGYAAGAVTLAAGLLVWRTAPRREDRPTLSAALTPGGATLIVGWSR